MNKISGSRFWFLVYACFILLLDGLILVLGLVFRKTDFSVFAAENWVVILFGSFLLLVLGRMVLFNPAAPAARLKPESPLARQLRMLEYTLDNSSELIFWIDETNRIFKVNSRLLAVLGYEEEEVLGQTPDFIDSQYRGRMEEIRNQLRAGNYYFFESQHRKKNGQLLPVESILNHFSHGREEFVCAFCRDVSERKRAEKDLTSAKETLELFLEGLPGGAFVRKPPDRVVYMNRKLRDMGLSIQEGHKGFDAAPPRLADLLVEMDWETLRSELPVRRELDGLLLDDGRRDLEIWEFPLVLSENEPLIGGILLDVTQRRRDQQDLFEQQAFLEATIAQSPVGIIILDGKTTNIRICNQGAKEILGISRTENLEGKTVSFDGLIWEVLTPERTAFPLQENPLYKAFFHETASNDKMILRRADGQERFVMINSGPIYDQKGEFMAAIVAFLDISELKETQDRLETLNRSLETLVQDRTKALSEANGELLSTIQDLVAAQEQLIESEKMASLGGLVAGVAHEINTPLGVSVTAASYLQEAASGIRKRFEENQMKKSDLDGFLRQTDQSTQLVLTNLERASNLIKSFKMISVDQSSGQARVFKLGAYIQDVFLSLHPPDKGLHLEIAVEGDEALSLNSYPGAFSQILTNLYMNSCVHGFEGRKTGRVSLSFWVEGERLFLKYEDDGKGMDEATLKRIYEPFFTTKRNRGGSGLGLHIVFNLLTQKLAGTIRATSEPGKGTSFLLEMPL